MSFTDPGDSARSVAGAPQAAAPAAIGLAALAQERSAATPASLFEAALAEADRSPGVAASFSAASQQFLAADNYPALRAGAGGFGIALWFRLASQPAHAGGEYFLVAKDSDAPAGARDYTLGVTRTGAKSILRFYVNGGSAIVESAEILQEDTWYFLLAWHDPAAGRLRLRINQDAPIESAAVPAIHQSSAQFRIGARQYAGAEGYFDGRVDQVAFFKAPPAGVASVIGAIGDRLYNGGEGLAYDRLSPAEKAAWGLVSWWDLDEASGARADRHGANHLTPINGPTTAEGKVGDLPGTAYGPAWTGDAPVRVGVWSLAGGTLAPSYDPFGPRLMHAEGRPGYRSAAVNTLGGTAWELGIRSHSAVRPGMAEVELYREAGSDGAAGRVVLDAEGRPTYRGAGPGGAPEVVAACPVPLYGRMVVTGGSATATTTPKLGTGGAAADRTICRLYVADLGNACMGDVVTVRGCGAPFDGERLLTIAFDDPAGGPPYLEFVVDGHAGAGNTPTAGEVIPTGEHEDPCSTGGAVGGFPRRQVRPAALRIRREGGSVSFWESGWPLGRATAALPEGPAVGVVATVGGPGAGGPAELPTRVEGFAAPLPDAAALALDIRLCVRVSGVVDYAGNACHVDCESFPGVRRRQSQLHDFVVLFTDARGNLLDGPIDPETGDRYGVGYGDYSACDLGHEDQRQETEYRVHVAAFGKRWSTTGQPLSPSLIGVATVAEPRRIPWARALYVDAAAGDDANDGSEAAPLQSWGKAREVATPGTVVRLRQPEPPASGIGSFGRWEFVGDVGPVLYTTWGPGRLRVDQQWDNFNVRFTNAKHLTLKRIEIHHRTTGPHPQNGHAGKGIAFGGETAGILLKDVLDTGAVLTDGELGGGGSFLYDGQCRYVAAHDCVVQAVPEGIGSGYAIFFHQSVRRVSLRRVDIRRYVSPAQHVIRMAGGDAVEIGGCRCGPVDGDTGLVTVTLRTAPRRFTVFDCDFADRTLAFSPSAQPPEGGGIYDPTTHRCTAIRVRAGELKVEIPGGHRFSQCYAAAGAAFTTGSGYDLATYRAYPIVVEGCRYTAGSEGLAAPVLAAPTSGPRRNRQSYGPDSGEPLWAPSAVALAAPAGWAALAVDGLPQGGVGPKATSWRVGGATIPGTFAPVLALPLAMGAYESGTDVVDASGTKAPDGGGATVFVVGDGSSADYLLAPPAAGLAGEPSGPFTVALPEAARPVGPVAITITPASDGPGRFDPTRVTLTAESPSATFRFIADRIGTWAISTTNDAELVDPGPVTFVATITADEPDGEDPLSKPPVPPAVVPIPWHAMPEVRSGADVEVRSLAARPLKGEGDRRAAAPGAARRSLAAPPRRRGS